MNTVRDKLLANLNDEQRAAVRSQARLLGVLAGAGSGKTEVMSRKVAWWVGVEEVDRSKIIAFTFTEAAAEELKFRVRRRLEDVASEGEEATLSGMYVGTIHAFCLKCLRDFAPDEYYNFDVLDDAGRISLIQKGLWGLLSFKPFFEAARDSGRANSQGLAIDLFLRSYDILNEHVALAFDGPDDLPPRIEGEREWCAQFTCTTDLGDDELSEAFSTMCARYYAYLRARRFLDFSTAQAEFVRKLRTDATFLGKFLGTYSHMVVDEVQDINPAQAAIIDTLIQNGGHVTAVGDHRQAIYSFRGGRVDLMGDLFARIETAKDGEIQPLPANYRSTPRIIEVANRWSQSIGAVDGLTSDDMTHGRTGRVDRDPSHVGHVHFDSRNDEARWIARTIKAMTPRDGHGAAHDDGENDRGLEPSDIAVLVRSSTDIATYREILQEEGVPTVVRGGADLFSQPEVLVFLSALALAAGSEEFFGASFGNSLPMRVQNVLGTNPRHEEIVPTALDMLRDRGLSVPADAADRLLLLCALLHLRITEEGKIRHPGIASVRNKEARDWLGSAKQPRRLFPQTLFLWVLEEVGFGEWGEIDSDQFEAVRFHVGQVSQLLLQMESSGWIGPGEQLKYQWAGLMTWGARAARTPAAPLLVPSRSVSITTIHSAKGLEFPAVFVADVCALRLPSSRAKVQPVFAFDATRVGIDPSRLADNNNNDDERRLFYVALTRAERFLYTSASGAKRSRFMNEAAAIMAAEGCIVGSVPEISGIEIVRAVGNSKSRLSTSFSDLRYFLECPQDFFIRKVLGFAPPIGQEFGYGRGVHNLLRSVHERPAEWAALANDEAALRARVEALVDQGQFYLRHTVGQPYENLKNKAVLGVTEYVRSYTSELARLNFEPEKPFETLIPEEDVLITGAIDLVRLDNPPTVTLIDFKSGNASGDNASGLSKEMMAMQLGVYGIAAHKELEYEPDLGLVRYIGETDPKKRELRVDMEPARRVEVRANIAATASRIKKREFRTGPAAHLPDRCKTCDFGRICPSVEARAART